MQISAVLKANFFDLDKRFEWKVFIFFIFRLKFRESEPT